MVTIKSQKEIEKMKEACKLTALVYDEIEKYIKQAGFKSLGIFKEFNIEKNNKKEKIQFIIFTKRIILS